MLRTRSLCLAVAAVIASSVSSAVAEDWPAWRGPRGDGSSLESTVPTRWSASDNVAWKAEIPGEGYASPVIWGDRVFTVTALVHSGDRAPDRGGNTPTNES